MVSIRKTEIRKNGKEVRNRVDGAAIAELPVIELPSREKRLKILMKIGSNGFSRFSNQKSIIVNTNTDTMNRTHIITTAASSPRHAQESAINNINLETTKT